VALQHGQQPGAVGRVAGFDDEVEDQAAPAGGQVELVAVGNLAALADDVELTLYWIGGYGGVVFLPFKDATSGHETYGGGRNLLDTVKSADLGTTADGRAILDFNFAYHPSCVYSDRWTCPLAPPANVLPKPVRGGERLLAIR
jgi:uncharacterized protein